MVTSPDPRCASDQSVQIFRRRPGSGGFRLIDTIPSNGSGQFATTFTATRSGSYRAHIDETDRCLAADSNIRTVLVKARVNLRMRSRVVPRGEVLRIRVYIAPCVQPEGTVTLMRKVGGTWGPNGTAQLGGSCTAVFFRRISAKTAFQATWSSPRAGIEPGKSAQKEVRLRR